MSIRSLQKAYQHTYAGFFPLYIIDVRVDKTVLKKIINEQLQVLKIKVLCGTPLVMGLEVNTSRL